MQTQGTEIAQKQPSTWMGAAMGIAMIPVLFVGACVAIPYTLGARWLRLHGEHKLRALMKSQGRLMAWPEFVRVLHERGGTCIEEKFTAKGPVRIWWTPEDVRRESPHDAQGPEVRAVRAMVPRTLHQRGRGQRDAGRCHAGGAPRDLYFVVGVPVRRHEGAVDRGCTSRNSATQAGSVKQSAMSA